MSRFSNSSIKNKLRWIIIVSSASALLFSSVAFIIYDILTFRESMVNNLVISAKIVGENSSAALLFKDVKSAEATLQGLRANGSIITACIYDEHGRPFAMFSRNKFYEYLPFTYRSDDQYSFKEPGLVLSKKIYQSGEIAGTVYIVADTQELYDRIFRYLQIIGLILIGSLLTALIVSTKLQKFIAEPIHNLLRITKDVTDNKDYTLRAVKLSNDEVGQLIDGFNDMLAQIQQRDSDLITAHASLEVKVAARTKELQDEVETRRQKEEELKQFTAKLERSNRELQDFASVASHDLQEPLRKVQAFADRLKTTLGDALNDKGRDYMDRMLNATQRMQVLINDLLVYSRVTTKAQPFVKTDLQKIVHDVVSDLEIRIENAGGRVEFGDLPTIDADPLQMRQLFQNIIGNALKFTKPNQPPIVTVQAKIYMNGHASEAEALADPAHMFEITIQDNGIGFDEKYSDQIFVIFQRLHGRNEYEGTGIGLAVCRKIVERHGGQILASSKEGEGARFTIKLPVAQLKPATHV